MTRYAIKCILEFTGFGTNDTFLGKFGNTNVDFGFFRIFGTGTADWKYFNGRRDKLVGLVLGFEKFVFVDEFEVLKNSFFVSGWEFLGDWRQFVLIVKVSVSVWIKCLTEFERDFGIFGILGSELRIWSRIGVVQGFASLRNELFIFGCHNLSFPTEYLVDQLLPFSQIWRKRLFLGRSWRLFKRGLLQSGLLSRNYGGKRVLGIGLNCLGLFFWWVNFGKGLSKEFDKVVRIGLFGVAIRGQSEHVISSKTVIWS